MSGSGTSRALRCRVFGHKENDGLAAHGDSDVQFTCTRCGATEWRHLPLNTEQ